MNLMHLIIGIFTPRVYYTHEELRVKHAVFYGDPKLEDYKGSTGMTADILTEDGWKDAYCNCIKSWNGSIISSGFEKLGYVKGISNSGMNITYSLSYKNSLKRVKRPKSKSKKKWKT